MTEHAGEILDHIEEFLGGIPGASVPDRVLATVMFTDIVSSTDRVVSMGDRRWKAILEAHDDITRDQVARFQGRFIESTGDGVLATFDRPELREGGHRVGGIAVHIAARVTAMAAPGEILASSTVRDLVAGSGVEFADRGTHDLKGVPGRWHLCAVDRSGPAGPESRRARAGPPATAS